ncbi:hypothetical protein JHK82_014633 [Glycine max]|nr:hypothetical protein JHK87_014547 [Glycine soja]KAG5031018.1 hypothetical protein JHK85_015000 [Glycine max]KAG5045248.1 hypothetical protein JHK86_014654 [Glycine max]KAG5147752.1 hypothetical protein JHK82_014633 [Glycine max]
MASSEPIPPEAEPESHLSSLIYEISNEVQGIMENMFKTVTFRIKTCDYFVFRNLNSYLSLVYSEINQSSAVVEEEIEKCKGSALERKRALDEEKDNFQKAAYAVLDMLSRE